MGRTRRREGELTREGESETDSSKFRGEAGQGHAHDTLHGAPQARRRRAHSRKASRKRTLDVDENRGKGNTERGVIDSALVFEASLSLPGPRL
eukprot:scaffold17359_cov142-Isochrysis_galbana.AAC.5